MLSNCCTKDSQRRSLWLAFFFFTDINHRLTTISMHFVIYTIIIADYKIHNSELQNSGPSLHFDCHIHAAHLKVDKK